MMHIVHYCGQSYNKMNVKVKKNCVQTAASSPCETTYLLRSIVVCRFVL